MSARSAISPPCGPGIGAKALEAAVAQQQNQWQGTTKAKYGWTVFVHHVVAFFSFFVNLYVNVYEFE